MLTLNARFTALEHQRKIFCLETLEGILITQIEDIEKRQHVYMHPTSRDLLHLRHDTLMAMLSLVEVHLQQHREDLIYLLQDAIFN